MNVKSRSQKEQQTSKAFACEAACGHIMPNDGQRGVTSFSQAGCPGTMGFQVAAVNDALGSVATGQVSTAMVSHCERRRRQNTLAQVNWNALFGLLAGAAQSGHRSS